LAILGPLHGWLALRGAIFCSHPVLIYWAGLGCTGLQKGNPFWHFIILAFLLYFPNFLCLAIWMAVSTADLV
jgi:hypothetical protein